MIRMARQDRGYTFDGTKLRQVRLGRRLTQVGLAAVLDCDPVYVQMLERGRRWPSITFIARMETALGVTAEELGVIWTRPPDETDQTDP